MSLTLGFTGDVMLGRVVDVRQRERPATAVWGDVLDRLLRLDGLFVNLECCLSTRGQPWTRTDRPFHFRADPEWAVPALREAGVDWATLANNHLLDFEEPALLDTLDALDEAGIAWSGAGPNVWAARAPATVDVDGLTVAFVSLTDNTPEYAAGRNSPGVAHLEFDFDDADDRAVVRAMLDEAREADPDLLVASLHLGPNIVAEPFESHERWCRWLCAEGVDVVHGHSAHVFQAVEARDDGLILYDCGDFVDDYAVDDELRNDRSFLFELIVDGDGTATTLRLVPIEIAGCRVRRATDEVARWCRETMRERSQGYGTAHERDGESLVVAL